jgi:hypothetical protein
LSRHFFFRSTFDNAQETTTTTVKCTGQAVGQGGNTKIDSHVFFSAKNMLEVWDISRHWYPIASLWKLPCCEVLLLCVSNRGLGFTQARLQKRWRRM